MGICSCSNNEDKRKIYKTDNKEEDKISSSHRNKKKDHVINLQNVLEGKEGPIGMEKKEQINEQMKKFICKIIVNNKYGTGFLCKIPYPDEFNLLPVLITNKTLINQEELFQQKQIEITLDNDREEKTIYITTERKVYSSKKYDITFIEIFRDEIKEFLDLDIKKQISEKNNIYVLQYSKGINSEMSFGVIKSINDEKIKHTCSEISGGPILLLETMRIIGINLGNYKGILLEKPIKEFNVDVSNKIKKNSSGSKYIDCYYIIKPGKEFNLLNDFNENIGDFIRDDEDEEEDLDENLKKYYNRTINMYNEGKKKKKFLEKNINIFIDSQPIKFRFKYRTNNKKIHVKFVFKNILNDLSFIFYNCENLESIDFSSYDMAQITNTFGMFYDCSNLKSVNLSSLNSNKEIDMGSMFFGCKALNLIEFPLNHKNKVTNISHLFFECSSLKSIDLSSFNTINVKDMSNLFSKCNSLKTIYHISSLNTGNVTDMSRMFAFCHNLSSIDLSKLNI